MESYLSCQEDEVGLLVSEVVKKQQNYILKVFECSLEGKCKSQKVSLAFHPATFNMDGHDKSRISKKKKLPLPFYKLTILICPYTGCPVN